MSKAMYFNCHTGAGRYPDVVPSKDRNQFKVTGFRVALRLHGMTKKVIATQFVRGNDDTGIGNNEVVSIQKYFFISRRP
jgi:hypothetical protein